MNPSFDDCGFFTSDSLLHAEVPCPSFGFPATATPYRLRHDGWSGLMLLLCLFLAASLVLRLREKFSELVRGVFLFIPGKTDEPLVCDPLRNSTRFIAVCLLSLTATVVAFTYTQNEVEYYPFPETPYILLAAFLGLWLAYFLTKRLLYDFINWIFFRREKIFTWGRAYTFLLSAESMLFLLLALVVVYLPVSSEMVQIIALVPILFVKIILLFKIYQIFFPKKYGTLHLFVYFCTLELMPLLVMQHILMNAGWLLTVKI